MKYTIVLNGCSETFNSQAEEISGFLQENTTWGKEAAKADTIILYCDEAKKAELIKNSPVGDLRLVKIVRYQPENVLEVLKQLETGRNTVLYLFPGDCAGSELAVRFSCRLGGSSLVGVSKIEAGENGLICYKPVYSNHMLGEFEMHRKPYCISIAKGSASKSTDKSTSYVRVEELDMTGVIKDGFVKEYRFDKEEAASGLEESKFIIAAGRGAGNRENLKNLETAARELGAALGVSRPAAMNAWASMQQLIGVSGAMTKPELCIAAGVSGAAAFYAGIEKSKFIIAINTDEKSSIISHSDVAVIDDYRLIFEELLKLVNENKTGKDK